jgi:PBP1b-binding outer membrane lipoprotein LpoB
MHRDIRIAGVAIVGAALVLSGCSGKSDTAATSTSSVAKESSAAPTPKASDDDQIRDVMNQESAAFSAWDFAKVGTFTCAKFRSYATSVDSAIPPMKMFSADTAASMGAQEYGAQIGQEFAGASEQSLQAVADAIIRQDEAAYKAAMLDVVKQTMSVQLVKVDNIVVNGDTATADATLTQRVGNKEPQSRTSAITLVREGGTWLDCTPPEQQQ